MMAVPEKLNPANVIGGSEYKGQYFDIFGYQGEIRLSLTGVGENYSGSCEIVIAGNHAPLIYRGNVEAVFHGKAYLESTDGTLRLDLKLGDEEKPYAEVASEQEKFSAESAVSIRSASSYAERAIYGVIPADPATGLGGGVWIAWHFAASS